MTGEPRSGSVPRALSIASAATVWSAGLLPASGLGARGRAVANASFALGVAAVSGLDARQLGVCNGVAGSRWGAAASTAPIVAAGVVAAIPALRHRVRPSGQNLAEWIAFRIPVGTVLTEELLFRGVLDALSPVASPIIFGLWHIHPARAAGDSVVGTVAGTAFAGALFSWLRARSGSVLAPMLLHFTVNASGAVLAHLAGARRTAPERSRHRCPHTRT